MPHSRECPTNKQTLSKQTNHEASHLYYPASLIMFSTAIFVGLANHAATTVASAVVAAKAANNPNNDVFFYKCYTHCFLNF